MSELEPLEDDILALVGAAKQIPELTGARKAELFEATATKIGAPTPGGDGGGAGTGAGAGGAAQLGTKMTLALIATFAVGIAVGVLADRALSVDRSAAPEASSIVLPTPRVATEPDAGAHAAEVETVSPASLPDAPKAAPGASAAPQRAAASTEALSSRGLAAERALLDVARSALARGEAGEALAATSRHAHEYADGALVEEREAIAVKALVALGRKDEARTRVRALEQRFPAGLSVRAAKAAVDGAP